MLALLCFYSLTALAVFKPGAYIVSGKVLDEQNKPLTGVLVSEIGVNNQTKTDETGSYSISINTGEAVLRFSCPGYELQEIKTSHSFTRDIVLKRLSSNLQEKNIIGFSKTMRSYMLREKALITQDPNYQPDQAFPYAQMEADPQLPNSREGYDAMEENRFKKVLANPLSTFSIDVDGAAYSNIRRFINNGSLPPAGAVRIEELINYFHYDYPQPVGEHPFSINTEIAECPWNKSHRLALIGLQGKIIPTEKLPASNLVFLIDVSGSMDEPNKLPLVKASIKMLVEKLRPEDRVAIVVYAGHAGMVLPPVRGNEKNLINKAIENLQAGGSTAGGAGIQLAYKTAKEYFNNKGNNRVILCTDGDFNVGASSDDELVRMIETERKSGIFLSILGFGTGNYQDAKMQQLANKGNGNHSYIDNLNEAKKVLVTAFGGTLFTIAKDVKLQVEFNPAKVQAYRLLGYENRMLNKEDFNNDKKDAGELGSGHTVTALYEIIPAGLASELIETVDNLKYQKPAKLVDAGNELMTIKFRYKTPSAEESILLVQPVRDLLNHSSDASQNFKFAASVAEFGLLIRNSAFKQNASYKNVLSRASAAIGDDKEGYRAAFLKLVQKAWLLTDNNNKVEDLGLN